MTHKLSLQSLAFAAFLTAAAASHAGSSTSSFSAKALLSAADLAQTKNFFSYNSSYSVQPKDNGTFLLQSRGLWGQFGMKQTSALDLSNATAISFQVRNLGPSAVVAGIRLDFNSASTAWTSPSFKIDGNATKTVVFELKPRTLDIDNTPAYRPEEAIRITDSGLNAAMLSTVCRWQFFSGQDAPANLEFSKIEVMTSQPSLVGIVDQYGQATKNDWPTKVGDSESILDLANDEKNDQAIAGTVASFGGDLSTRTAFVANGKWGIGKDGTGRNWFSTPQGKRFWSFGLNTIVNDSGYSKVDNRSSLFEWLPQGSDPLTAFYRSTSGANAFSFYRANLYRKYGKDWSKSWVDGTRKRLASWGVNTIGAWSDPNLPGSDIPFTRYLDTTRFPTRLPAASNGNDIPDPYDPTFASWCAANFSVAVASDRLKSNLMGIYVDNELMWGRTTNSNADYAMAQKILAGSLALPARSAFIGILTAKYGSVANLNRAWGTSYATMQQAGSGSSLATPNATAMSDLKGLLNSLAKTYYQKVDAGVAAAAPTTLYLGSRMGLWCTPDTVVQAASASVDALSMNLYLKSADMPWDYLSNLSKPVILSEFGVVAGDEAVYGLTSKNFLPAVSTQADRADEIGNILASARACKNIVGATMFQYVDQPATGREWDTENYNLGVVNVVDAPYMPLVTRFRSFAKGLYGN